MKFIGFKWAICGCLSILLQEILPDCSAPETKTSRNCSGNLELFMTYVWVCAYIPTVGQQNPSLPTNLLTTTILWNVLGTIQPRCISCSTLLLRYNDRPFQVYWCLNIGPLGTCPKQISVCIQDNNYRVIVTCIVAYNTYANVDCERKSTPVLLACLFACCFDGKHRN